MTPRTVVKMVLDGKQPPYVPWSFRFTHEPLEMLQQHYGNVDLEDELGNHILELGSPIGFFEDAGNQRVRDGFGVIWDRTHDKDIGNVEGFVLPEPSLKNYQFPDPHDKRFFADIEARITRYPDRFRLFTLGFSLFERAWTLRGMENLMLDMIEKVSNLLNLHRLQISRHRQQEGCRWLASGKAEARAWALTAIKYETRSLRRRTLPHFRSRGRTLIGAPTTTA